MVKLTAKRIKIWDANGAFVAIISKKKAEEILESPRWRIIKRDGIQFSHV